MDIYLDNSATTKPYKKVVETVASVMEKAYGNPSSLHKKGIEAEKVLKTASKQVADSIGAKPGEVFFVSGGTEANNLALFGVSGAGRGKHVITTVIEHPATKSTISQMRQIGCTIDILAVDKNGLINPRDLESLITPDTVLVSVMHVNNELGTVQDIAGISRIIKSQNPRTYLHVDAIQSYGKIPFTVNSLGADLVSLSSHKVHGPKGVGALYVRSGVKIAPMIFGGGQQKGLRPGTENVQGIAGFGVAAKMTVEHIGKKYEYLKNLRDLLKQGILETVENVSINTNTEVSAPHILNVSFLGVKSEIMLHALETKGIYVSSGSACSSHKKTPSYVLTAIGAPDEVIDSSIRFSFSEFNEEVDVVQTVKVLRTIVPELRKVVKSKG